jgi:hypothetical protein
MKRSLCTASLPALLFAFGSAALLAACGGSQQAASPAWQMVEPHLDSALLSVWGTSASDVWAAGSDARDGHGPLVLHFDGASWQRLPTGQNGDLWWAFGFESGPVYLGGVGGTILRYQDGAFTRMQTPGTGTVFGIWGSAPDDLWAVGGAQGGAQGAFAWRNTGGDSWQPVADFPAQLAASDALWKVFGHGSDDVWLVGTGGKVLHWNGSALSQTFIGISESLFTVHANSQRFAAVGGYGSGLILERDISAPAGAPWENQSPQGSQGLVGVCLTDQGGYAVGQFGYIARRDATGWRTEDTGLPPDADNRSLHSVWVDPDGGVWAVGGQVLVEPLVDGWLLHKGASVPALE